MSPSGRVKPGTNTKESGFSPFYDIDSGMGPYDQLNIQAIYCHIMTGGVEVVDENLVGTINFSDVINIYWPTRPNDLLPLPLCCNPRPWEGLYLEIWRDNKKLLRGNDIPLGIFNNADHLDPGAECDPLYSPNFCHGNTGKILILIEPLSFYPTEKFRMRVRNDNSIGVADDTSSIVMVSFLTEIIDKRATLGILGGELNGLEDMT